MIHLEQARGHICRTPLRACEIAQSGDTVTIEDGTYDGDLNACHGHESYRRNVVFAPEPGHQCRMTYPKVPAPFSNTSCPVNLTGTASAGGLALGGYAGRSCGVTGNPLPHTISAARRSTWINHLTFRGINVGAFYATCAAHIKLEHDLGSDFFIGEGAYHLYVLGGDYGNRVSTDAAIGDTTCGCNDWPPAEDVRIEGAVIHDFIVQDQTHGDGLFIAPSYRVRIANNILARNDCIPIYVNYLTDNGQPIGVHGLRIIGNVIHTDTMHNGGPRCYQGISLGNNDQTDTIVAFNSLEGPIRRSNADENNQNILIVGNVSGEINAADAGNSPGCGFGTTASFNVLTDTRADRCGDSSNLKVRSPFVSNDAEPNSPSGTDRYFVAPLGEYTLRRRAKAIGRVPAKWCEVHRGVCPKRDVSGKPRPNPAHPSYYDAGAYENR